MRLTRRIDAVHSGTFSLQIDLRCSPEGEPYPAGGGSLNSDLTDSLKGSISLNVFEQVTTTGEVTPTAYMNGRCDAEGIRGCRFWLSIADNGTPDRGDTSDVIGFVVLDGNGKRIAYGTGPLMEGDLHVAPNSF